MEVKSAGNKMLEENSAVMSTTYNNVIGHQHYVTRIKSQESEKPYIL